MLRRNRVSADRHAEGQRRDLRHEDRHADTELRGRHVEVALVGQVEPCRVVGVGDDHKTRLVVDGIGRVQRQRRAAADGRLDQ
jgi:hypothetical protein